MSLSTYLFGVWPLCCATPLSSPSRVRAHEQCRWPWLPKKIHSWVSFSFLYEYGIPLGGEGPPKLRYNMHEKSLIEGECQKHRRQRGKTKFLYIFHPFYFKLQAAQAHNARSYIVLFTCTLTFTETWHVAYTIFDCAKRDSNLAAYGSVVLQRLEFIKVCMRMQRFRWKSRFRLYFVN